MLKINCLELLEGRKYTNKRKKHLLLLDNSLFLAVFSCTEHIDSENMAFASISLKSDFKNTSVKKVHFVKISL